MTTTTKNETTRAVEAWVETAREAIAEIEDALSRVTDSLDSIEGEVDPETENTNYACVRDAKHDIDADALEQLKGAVADLAKEVTP